MKNHLYSYWAFLAGYSVQCDKILSHWRWKRPLILQSRSTNWTNFHNWTFIILWSSYHLSGKTAICLVPAQATVTALLRKCRHMLTVKVNKDLCIWMNVFNFSFKQKVLLKNLSCRWCVFVWKNIYQNLKKSIFQGIRLIINFLCINSWGCELRMLWTQSPAVREPLCCV